MTSREWVASPCERKKGFEMYISVITLPVDDVERAIDFYTKKLGWDKTMDVAMEYGRWVTVQPKGGQASLTLSKYTPDDGMTSKPGGNSGVIIEVDDVYKSCDQLKKAGVQLESEPTTQPWGGWAQFKDSEGNIHGLHSPVPAGVSAN